MIWDLLTTPEDHRDAYVWAAVLLAHCAIGFILVAVTARRMGAWNAAATVSAVAFWVWELSQVMFFGGGIADGLVDAAGMASGAVLAASLWERRLAPLWAALALLCAIGLNGWRQRK